MGKQSTSLNFKISDDTKVVESCGITFNGQFFIYGGYSNKRQIAKVNGCSLETVGSLEFDFFSGGCTNANNQILLCFHQGSAYDQDSDHKTCYSSMDPLGPFTTIQKSIYEHGYTRIASSECNFYLVYILN